MNDLGRVLGQVERGDLRVSFFSRSGRGLGRVLVLVTQHFVEGGRAHGERHVDWSNQVDVHADEALECVALLLLLKGGNMIRKIMIFLTICYK